MMEQNFSVQTQYEMALLERLQQFEVTPELLAEMTGLPLENYDHTIGHHEYDTDLIHEIAEYLIDFEELGDDFLTSDERNNIINIGMFIHGWIQYRKNLDA